MKVICRTSCFYSKGLKRFDEGEIYDLNQEQLKQIHAADMDKYFTNDQGDNLGIVKVPEVAKAETKAETKEK